MPYPDLGTKGSWDTWHSQPCVIHGGLQWELGQGGGGSWPQCPGSRVVAPGPDAPVSRAATWVWRCQGALVAQGWSQTWAVSASEGNGRWGDGCLQEAPPIHISGLCILVALNYTFACVITSHAGRLKLPRVILGQATITTSFCCGDMTFDCLIATGFGSGPVAKAVSLA